MARNDDNFDDFLDGVLDEMDSEHKDENSDAVLREAVMQSLKITPPSLVRAVEADTTNPPRASETISEHSDSSSNVQPQFDSIEADQLVAEFMKQMGQMMPDGTSSVDPDQMRKGMEQIMKVFHEESKQVASGSEDVTEPASRDANECDPQPSSEGDLDAAMRMIAEGARGIQASGDDVHDNNPLLQQLLQSLGGEEMPTNESEMETLLNSMMFDMMSKEALYEPVSKMEQSFSIWLDRHRGTLSAEDSTKYCKQYEIIKKIKSVFEREEDSRRNTEEVMELVHQMHECGEPPQEVLLELNPGLEFDADGKPKFQGLDQAGVGPDGCQLIAWQNQSAKIDSSSHLNTDAEIQARSSFQDTSK